MKLQTDDLPKIERKYVERVLPGGTTTFIHDVTFAEAMQIKRLAINYTGIKQNRQDFENIKPDSHILKIAQIMICCRESPNGEPTFQYGMGQEVVAIDNLNKWFPSAMVEVIVNESDSLCLMNYVPVEKIEERHQKEGAREILLEVMTDPKLWEQMNYLSFSLSGRELFEVNDENIGATLNKLHRHQAVQDKLIDAMFEWAKMMMPGA